MKKISKADAIEAGLHFYFTGNPCVYGHVDARYTNNGHCVRCVKNRSYMSRRGGNIKLGELSRRNRLLYEAEVRRIEKSALSYD